MTRKFIYSIAAMASALFALACQGNDTVVPEKPSTSTLSAVKDIADVAFKGDSTLKLSFKADSSWSVSSDKTWCELSVKSGSSGDASIELKIQANPQFESRQALLTFVEGVGPRAINKMVKVTQLPLERKITVTDVNGNPITKAILVPDDESGAVEYKVRVVVTANFAWYVSGAPIWMPDLKFSGEANESVRMWLSVDPSKLETSTQVGSVQYHDQSSLFVYNLDVEFAGVGNVYLKHDLPGYLNFAKDNSVGGMTQRFFNVVTSETYTSVETAPFRIITTEVKPDPTGGDNHVWYQDAFGVDWLSVYYNKAITRSLVSSVPWYIGATDNGGDIRAAAVLIVPKSALPADLNEMFEDVDGAWTLKEAFKQYYATTIVQQAAALAFTGTENYDFEIPAEGSTKPLIVKALNGIYSEGLALEYASTPHDWDVETEWPWGISMTYFKFNTISPNTTGSEKVTVVKVIYEDWNAMVGDAPTITPVGTLTFKQPAI